ncbi:BIRC7_8 [Mytilus edulis]|uniref:BIRC7_8 n=1 Tax=Mytilus edulis TaxID=6550 RepID=A0A8S3V6U0_MYTED|nr:BIRC7_8 [Mytilus edulis]
MPFLPQDFRTFLKDEEKSQSMQFEGARFSTFSTFPDIPGIYATRLAEAGFFYSGIPEFNTHTQHSQHGILNATGSIIQDVCTRSTTQNNQRESTALGVCLDKPKYPKYAIRSVRLDSFNHWPQHLTQSPEEMVTAGFFFTGTDDHCRCFFCGGGLRSWEPGDQPWIEHARWYQKCAFLRQCKGDKFIEDVQMNRILPNENENNWRPNSSGETRIPVTKPVEYSHHPAVMAVADFGYDERVRLLEHVCLKPFSNLKKMADITSQQIQQKLEQQPFNGTQKAKLDNLKEANKNKSTEEATCNPDLELSIRSLEEENQNLKDQQTCKICLDEPIAIVFLPCGHLAACTNCAPALRRCPICRAFIKGTVKAILS